MKYMKLGSKPDVFQNDGNNTRFVATELATDIIITVGEVKFFLHKFPLLSKSARLQKIVATTTNDETNDEVDVSDIPGGPAAFEICAKFCYGMVVTLNAYNVVAARCAAEYLEMHETIEKGNLIYKIDVFLSSSIFRTWKDSIIVLHTTKNLMPWAEELKIVSHCVDSIANKASIDPSEVEWSYTYNRKKLASENGLDQHWNGVRKQASVPPDWWVEDICELEMDIYKRVISAVKTKGHTSGSVLGEALKAYAFRKIPGLLDGSVSYSSVDVARHRNILETIVWLMPGGSGSVSCGFLLKLLKAACLFDAGENCRTELVKRVGQQLENASVKDLLIPAETQEEGSTVYDVDMVVGIIEEFMAQQARGGNGEIAEVTDPGLGFDPNGVKVLAVATLIDGYLAEIAKDLNLPLLKFVGLAEMISTGLRPVHDGLYRAIDMYLKEHPGLSKSEKKRLCGLMDCKRLSPEACMHAVQNERLPLRVVVQVLFFEQLRVSGASGNGPDIPAGVRSLLPRENGNSYGSSRSAATTYTEDDLNGAPVADLNSFRSMRVVNKSGGSERSSGSSDMNNGTGTRNIPEEKKGSKGILMPKKILSKIWSGKVHSGENSSSDTSESPGSINPEETKSTPSRITRHSVS
ncbi:Phototropic-responsive NPH3 family protein [Rhynchospora pubera]|uniref:Phototropic-responsive NPH3 family protein n=1 Tax=Rhynchospora pubera TaxID=906938 RepID=A0AAV8ELS1_9POAL|nr:Phototropic-responsive NPH3 family protein [Rhynchospora pubera]